MEKKLLVICGPTATGKTGFALKLAGQFEGELVSADSRQVYCGMDIGTGKDVKEQKFKTKNKKLKSLVEKKLGKKIKVGIYEVEAMPIWGLDLVKPNQRFSVADFVVFAKLIITDVWQRGKLPILVGGTGFYIKALLEGVDTLGIPPDWELRWQLKHKTSGQLFAMLSRLDTTKAASLNVSDRQNPRRLIRAIEIARQTSKSAPKVAKQKKIAKLETDKILKIGLKAPLDYLYQNINRRVDKRLKQGIKQEIKLLLKKGYGFSNSVLGETLGYQEWEGYFKNYKIPRRKLAHLGGQAKLKKSKLREEVIQRWKYNEHAYARRQLTWFKKQSPINWFDVSKNNWQKKAKKTVEKWVVHCG